VLQWIVRDTLEQIDVTKRLIAEHPEDLQYCDNPKCIRDAFKAGKVASMIGIEVREIVIHSNLHEVDT
jgi:membrane dipeptidase